MYTSGINPLKMLSKDAGMFWSFYVTSFIRITYLKYTKKKLRLSRYANHKVLSNNIANEILKEKISKNISFFFGRHGSVELNITTTELLMQLDIKQSSLEEINEIADNSGFYALDYKEVKRFCDEIKYSCAQIDMYGTFRMILEDYYIKKFMKRDVILTHLNMLDFWKYDNPFTSALKGKKVLVVHPFAAKIENQYKKRELLFKNPNVLPEFQLKTLKAVQTIMNNRDPRFNSWFEALDFMYREVMNIDFEIAILGCGAYGMPLSARLREAGKTVIYMGGVTQMLFGIKGDRWDKDPVASKLYNEHWTRPGDEDKPENFETVEGGCYW